MNDIATEKELKKQVSNILMERNKALINLGDNVFARITKKGVITLEVRVTSQQKDTRIPLGHYPDITLADARKKANQIRKEHKIKKINSEHHNECPTFKEYFNNNWFPEKSSKYKKGSTWPSNIKTLFKTTIAPSGLSDYRLDEITPALVCRLMKDVNQTPGNKHNSVSIIIMVCQKAVLEGVIPFNPIANLLTGSESPFPRPKAKGYKFIAPVEMKAKYFEPLSSTKLVNRCFYLLITLTGFRFGECRNLQWPYCDFDKRIIIIPSDAIGANKTQTDYYKPMTTQIYSLLKTIQRFQKNSGKYVFNSDYTAKPICEASFREPIKALTSRELDPHGIRKVMRTWFSSQGIAVNVAELALQHDVRSSLEKVYDKYKYIEEVREALQLWNNFIEQQLPDEFLELIRE